MTPKKLGRRIFKVLTTLVAIWGALQLVAWKISSGDEGSNRFNRTAIFGGNEFTSVAGGLQSGRVAAVLGGIAVDLRGAQLDGEGSTNSTLVFSGTTHTINADLGTAAALGSTGSPWCSLPSSSRS